MGPRLKHFMEIEEQEALVRKGDLLGRLES